LLQSTYSVSSAVDADAFRIFLATLEGAKPELTTENMTDQCLLCNEFGFARPFSDVTNYIWSHSVVNTHEPNGARDITEENSQIKETLSPVTEALSGMIKMSLDLTRSNESLQPSLCLLQKEVLDLRETEMRNIAEIWEELGELRTQLAREQTKHALEQESMKRENARRMEEIAELRRHQETFTQGIGNLKQQFTQLSGTQTNNDKKIGDMDNELAQAKQEVENVKQQITQLSGTQANSDKKIGDLNGQLAQTKREVESLRKQFLDERAKSARIAE
jgi:chromosome segregation ATPase